jgi:hypothetical protein
VSRGLRRARAKVIEWDCWRAQAETGLFAFGMFEFVQSLLLAYRGTDLQSNLRLAQPQPSSRQRSSRVCPPHTGCTTSTLSRGVLASKEGVCLRVQAMTGVFGFGSCVLVENEKEDIN